jgi:hypothetical protein
MERLARLKVQRTVLHLNEHVVAKRAVERFEFVVRLFDAVDGHGVAVDERAPHRDAAVRCERVGQHVRTVGVRALVVLWPRLTLRVRLDQQPAKVRNDFIDLIDLRLPPLTHGGVERIGCLETTDLDWRAETRREKNANAVRTKNAGERPHLQ